MPRWWSSDLSRLTHLRWIFFKDFFVSGVPDQIDSCRIKPINAE